MIFEQIIVPALILNNSPVKRVTSATPFTIGFLLFTALATHFEVYKRHYANKALGLASRFL